MTFVGPGFLWLMLLVPVGLWIAHRHGAPAVRFAPAGFLLSGQDAFPRSWRVRLLYLPAMLQVAGLLLTVVALSRPVRIVPIPVSREGIDIMLCIDTSSSMAGFDLDPKRTRLDVAKAAAVRFIDGRPNDRIGVVGFARFPDLLSPPTPDHDALRTLIADMALVESDGPEDATGIGAAVARAAQVLEGSGGKSRLIILLTDGEENVATADRPEEIAPLHAGQLCERLGVRLYAIAAGQGSRNADGEWVPIDHREVRTLARRTGGRFFTARDAGAVAAVYAEIDALEKVEFAEPLYDIEERFMPFLLAAIALLLAGRLLRSGMLP